MNNIVISSYFDDLSQKTVTFKINYCYGDPAWVSVQKKTINVTAKIEVIAYLLATFFKTEVNKHFLSR